MIHAPRQPALYIKGPRNAIGRIKTALSIWQGSAPAEAPADKTHWKRPQGEQPLASSGGGSSRKHEAIWKGPFNEERQN